MRIQNCPPVVNIRHYRTLVSRRSEAIRTGTTRREIIAHLNKRDMTPSELLERINVTQPTLSH